MVQIKKKIRCFNHNEKGRGLSSMIYKYGTFSILGTIRSGALVTEIRHKTGRQTKDIFGKRVPDGYVGRERGDIHIDIQTGSLNNVDDFIHYFTIMIYFLIGIQSCLFVSGKPFFNELQI